MADSFHNLELFPWNDELLTGIEIIDEQHKKLVEIINNLARILSTASAPEIERAFADLSDYAAYHFETEEGVWREYLSDEADTDHHRAVHGAFLPEIQAIQRDFKDKPVADTFEKVIRFLIRWLVVHIVYEDKRFARISLNVKAGMPLAEAKHSADVDFRQSISDFGDIVLSMYDALSARSFDFMRERAERERTEKRLQAANEKLSALATTDPLTGLHNRRHFDDVLARELKRARREHGHLSFIMFDIDHFKNLNDRYGHAEGDVALRKIGGLLKRLCRRPGDYAFRLGGEEFGVISANTDQQHGEVFAELIRSSTAELAIENVGSSVCDTVTISVGVASYASDRDLDTDALFKLADARLYDAKEGGRDKVVGAG